MPTGAPMAAVLLVSPKTPFNVGASIRAASIFGARAVNWTGDRIEEAAWREARSKPDKERLPREERLKEYSHVQWGEWDKPDPIGAWRQSLGLVPVAVEVLDHAESLPDFVHPERALYIFGPEDGTLGAGWLSACHRFVRIPTLTRTPLNIAQAVNLVLYDRYVKERYA